MKQLKRPEIKLPDAKVPDFLGDLCRDDLRDRHLLPLVGLLLVAIVVVPFALSSSGRATAPATGRRRGRAAAGSATPDRECPASPASAAGLRDYRRRLRPPSAPRTPSDQQYAEARGRRRAGAPAVSPGGRSRAESGDRSERRVERRLGRGGHLPADLGRHRERGRTAAARPSR